ncbi:bifunctional lysylphosphatidylglycerol flippase/synthetase MprF [Bacteriovorax sp. PP10]|uniref:Phosphatidylglycerol lysyltransferase n=1 Tax=Bacteriovorax antarcticus TaxID=3088717 RepID=A0ABU5VQ11_9BACT|nr:bifunctional lysylphosphatidylglycerol flippase/synthetase MprF [Bacteriovorax sp. PP10]MEA9355136.1 bifunctional lysylphosphatidylglycerol flippase/synthetase MprF [Bacteriovorax sp. PP10]
MKFLKYTLFALPVLFCGLAIFLVHKELMTISFHSLHSEIADWSSYKIEIALLLTFVNFVVLSGYDWIGLKTIKAQLGWLKTFKISFFAYSLSNLVGHSLISGASLRLRYYSREGLELRQISHISLQNTISFWLGFLTLGGVGLIIYPNDASAIGLSIQLIDVIGFLLLIPVICYMGASWFYAEKEFTFGKHIAISIPTTKEALGFLSLSVLDLTLCSLVMYFLLPPDANIQFTHFLVLFVTAQLAGLISQVPGGLGVFDSVLLKLLVPFAPAHELLTSFVLFRIIYYFIPFFLTLAGVATDEMILKREHTKKATAIIRTMLSPIIAQLLAIATFISGIVLLFSSVFPAIASRTHNLHKVVPLFVMELSHWASSITGLFLLFLSFKLWGKNKKALHMVQILLIVGIITSLLKGFDYEEAILLSVILAFSLFTKDAFYRTSPPRFIDNTNFQIIIILGILLLSMYAGLFAYQEIPYSDALWFKFHSRGNAERFLRSTLTLFTIFIFIAVRTYLKSDKHVDEPLMTPEEEGVIEEILKNVTETDAQLVWTKDKHIMISEDKKAFIMYGIQSDSWVVLGDAYGEPASRKKLMHDFIVKADLQGAKPVFYQLSERSLGQALEEGLQIFKLGEEAHIDLTTFSLEGSSRKSLRNNEKRGEKEGLSFRIVPKSEVPAIMNRLKEISDIWMKDKNAKEKGFSLGFFREDYIKHFPCAIIEKDGKIMAFANLWLGAGNEISIDLMRYDTASPHGIMDYLFVKILLWGQSENFKSFNFGMAPLSGLRSNPWAPLWYKLGSFIYRHGEHFYNFQGLHDYKAKYDPQWKMRFIASYGGLSFLRTLTDVTFLIGGGALGVLGLKKDK